MKIILNYLPSKYLKICAKTFFRKWKNRIFVAKSGYKLEAVA